MEDDWLEDFNKPKTKIMETVMIERAYTPPPVVKEVVLREPPPSLIHTNAQTHYVLINMEIHLVLKLSEWVIERLNFLFLSKPYVVVIATDPGARSSITGYGVMQAMGRREVEVSWLRVWSLSAEQLTAKNLMSPELHRNTMYDETSNMHGRNICRLMDKLVFNSVETEYLNEREIIFKGKRSRLNKRFQNEPEVTLVNASYEEYCNLYDEGTSSPAALLPSLRVIY
jgi:hypothetical protein